jgi:hypothetical protein
MRAEEIDKIGIRELVQCLSQKPAIMSKMFQVVFDGKRTGKITAAFAGNTQFPSRAVHFFQQQYLRSAFRGPAGCHQSRRPAADHDYCV